MNYFGKTVNRRRVTLSESVGRFSRGVVRCLHLELCIRSHFHVFRVVVFVCENIFANLHY